MLASCILEKNKFQEQSRACWVFAFATRDRLGRASEASQPQLGQFAVTEGIIFTKELAICSNQWGVKSMPIGFSICSILQRASWLLTSNVHRTFDHRSVRFCICNKGRLGRASEASQPQLGQLILTEVSLFTKKSAVSSNQWGVKSMPIGFSICNILQRTSWLLASNVHRTFDHRSVRF